MADYRAIVGLSRGRVAYFDPKSNIMLDLARPTAFVYDRMNVEDLRKAIGGSIYLVDGSLSDLASEPVLTAELSIDNKEQDKSTAPAISVVEEPVAEKIADVAAETVNVAAVEEKPKTAKAKRNTKK